MQREIPEGHVIIPASFARRLVDYLREDGRHADAALIERFYLFEDGEYTAEEAE